jgi:hypothetical protein
MTQVWHSVVRPDQTSVGETELPFCVIRTLIKASPYSRRPSCGAGRVMLPRFGRMCLDAIAAG